MKKITFLFVAMFCFAFTWQSNAQFTEGFETEIPATWTVINGGAANTWVRLNNPTGGAQEGTAVASISFNATAHDDYLITPAIPVTAGVNESISFYVKSRSASFLEPYAVLLSTTTPTAGAFTTVLQATSEAPAAWTQLAFDLSSYAGSTVYVAVHATGTDEWQLFVDNFVNSPIPSTPECATTPFPADGAIDVPAGNVTFSWTAPASGPTPTSYNLYAYEDALGTNPVLIGNFPSTSADLTISAFDADIFWSAVPVNVSLEATGCDVWSFTTESYQGYCLFGDFGLFPATTFTPSTCDGTTPNVIATNSWPGEYSNVAVEAGQTYQFTTSTPDVITISFDGSTVEASGVSAVTWTATTAGTVRFYSNLNDNACGSAEIGRTKSVLCGPTLGVDEFDTTSLKVYPNPVKDVLYLSYTTEISSVAVYNMLGQVVLSKTVNANQESLNMSELNSGAYFVKVTINDKIETVRVIKQ